MQGPAASIESTPNENCSALLPMLLERLLDGSNDRCHFDLLEHQDIRIVRRTDSFLLNVDSQADRIRSLFEIGQDGALRASWDIYYDERFETKATFSPSNLNLEKALENVCYNIYKGTTKATATVASGERHPFALLTPPERESCESAISQLERWQYEVAAKGMANQKAVPSNIIDSLSMLLRANGIALIQGNDGRSEKPLRRLHVEVPGYRLGRFVLSMEKKWGMSVFLSPEILVTDSGVAGGTFIPWDSARNGIVLGAPDMINLLRWPRPAYPVLCHEVVHAHNHARIHFKGIIGLFCGYQLGLTPHEKGLYAKYTALDEVLAYAQGASQAARWFKRRGDYPKYALRCLAGNLQNLRDVSRITGMATDLGISELKRVSTWDMVRWCFDERKALPIQFSLIQPRESNRPITLVRIGADPDKHLELYLGGASGEHCRALTSSGPFSTIGKFKAIKALLFETRQKLSRLKTSLADVEERSGQLLQTAEDISKKTEPLSVLPEDTYYPLMRDTLKLCREIKQMNAKS